MYLEILCVTIKRIQYIAYFSMFKTIFIPSISDFVDAIKSGEYSRIFTGDYDSPDIELSENSQQMSSGDDFFTELTKQPDTSITIIISVLVPAFLSLGRIFSYKNSVYSNFFADYFFTYLSISFSTILVVISLVLITLGSNKLVMQDSAKTRECFLPLVCGYSYTYVPVLLAIKLTTLVLLLGWMLHMSTAVGMVIFVFLALYFSIAASKISVMTMGAMPSMSKDKRHVWLVAVSVFTIKLILTTHIYVNLI